MANKKLLICAALATGLLLTACVKKEEPKNEEQQEQAATETQTQPEPEKIQEFESLESVDKHEAPAPVVETTREETQNTTTEIRRETRPVQTETPAATQTPTEAPRAEGPARECDIKNPAPDPLFLPLPAHKGLEVKWVG